MIRRLTFAATLVAVTASPTMADVYFRETAVRAEAALTLCRPSVISPASIDSLINLAVAEASPSILPGQGVPLFKRALSELISKNATLLIAEINRYGSRRAFCALVRQEFFLLN